MRARANKSVLFISILCLKKHNCHIRTFTLMHQNKYYIIMATLSVLEGNIITIDGCNFTELGYAIDAMYHARDRVAFDNALQNVMSLVESCDANQIVHPVRWFVGNGQVHYYYTPLEYLVVIHNLRYDGDWIHSISKPLLSKGAQLYMDSFTSSNMLQYAVDLLGAHSKPQPGPWPYPPAQQLE